MTQRIVDRLDSFVWESPILQGLTEVDFFKDLLSTPAFDQDPHEEIQRFEVRTLKKHLRKTIIEYTVSFTGSTKNYIGIYRESDERLEHVFSVLKTLRSNGFTEDSKLTVPRPVLYIPALSFLLMDKAQGKLLREIFERKEDDPTPYARGAAQWLSKLHSSKVRLDGVKSRKDEVAASLRFTRAALWLFPRLKPEIQSISDQLIGLQEAHPPRARRPIHGDYHARNIIASPERTTVIDLEEARMGDPAFDLGYFMAQTKMTHGTGQTITQATESFLQEYLENQSSVDDHFAQSVAVFEAQTYLQRIYHTYYHLDLKPNFDQISEWLNECKNCLQKASAQGP
jgi:aminoglycoside phosphotransferase (APT) family kinase protein